VPDCARIQTRKRPQSGRPGQPGLIAIRRKASRSFVLPHRKVMQGGDLGHASQRQARIARCSLLKLPVGPIGTGEAVLAATTEDVRDWLQARQRLFQPTRRGQSFTRGAERCRPPKCCTGAWRILRKHLRRRVGHAGVNRSWPVRIARPSRPIARTARTVRVGERTFTPYSKMLGLRPVHIQSDVDPSRSVRSDS